jgi:hypothetical protein
MTQLVAPAGFSERLVPRSAKSSCAPCASEVMAPQAPDRGAEAEQASAAFQHYTEGLDEFRAGAREKTERPVATQTPAGCSVSLSEYALILLNAVASYERCSNEEAVLFALADYVRKIGAGPLARAVLDERDRTALKNLPDDLGDLPDFERSAVVRFRPVDGARKALRPGGVRR